MHKSVHRLTMLLVLYHTLVGCCWHHSHAETPEVLAEASVGATCCGHSHDEHGDRHEPSDPPHSDDSGCDHGTCVFFVPPTDAGTDAVDETAPVNGLCSDLPRHGILSASWAIGEPPRPAGVPSLRLHMVNQILLI